MSSPYTAILAAMVTKTLDDNPEALPVLLWAIAGHLSGRGLDTEQTVRYVGDMIRDLPIT